MKFNPRRWRLDERLRMCSAAARGAWIELICIMHDAEPYGHLVVAGKAPNDKMLSVMTGIPVIELSTLLSELEDNEVFSRTDAGVIFSRAMVRDEEAHRAAVEFGLKGAEAKARKQKAEKAPSRGGLSQPSRDPSRLESESEKESDKTPVVPLPDGTKHELPDDWEPKPFGKRTASGAIVASWTEERFDREVEKFRLSHTRKRSRYSDWQATWATWVLNSAEFDQKDRRAKAETAEPKSLAAIILEEERGRQPPPRERKKVGAH